MGKIPPSIAQVRDIILERFSEIQDPRVQGRCKYDLLDIVVTGFFAVACGFQTYPEMHFFASTRYRWLSSFVDFSEGFPSHDTFRRVFSLLLPQDIELILRGWAGELRESSKSKRTQIAIDGKALRGTLPFNNRGGSPLNLVSVFDIEDQIVLSQSRADGGGNCEMSAAINVIKHLNLKGAIITADAGIAHKDFTDQVCRQGANYFVPIKGANTLLHKLFEDNRVSFKPGKNLAARLFARHEEATHGRRQTRTAMISSSADLLGRAQELRSEIKTIVLITRERATKDNRPIIKTTDKSGKASYSRNDHPAEPVVKTESVYYISNLKLGADECLVYARSHWGIENNLHWVLDVHFSEDQQTLRDKRAARTLAAMRKLALNIFNLLPDNIFGMTSTRKPSLKTKMKLAALEPDYLNHIARALAEPTKI